MNIRPYLAPILKWWWLLLAAAALAGVTSYMIVRDQPPVFNSRTTLLIGQTLSQTNPSSNEFWLNQQLSGLYSDMAYREPIQQGVKEKLGMDWLPRYIVKPLGNSQFIEINVMDTVPERAMQVAAELANQLILISPTARGLDSAQNTFTEDQLIKTQDQIIETEQQIIAKQQELSSLQSAHEIETAQDDLATLQDKLELLRTNYASLLANSKAAVSNVLQIIEPASLPVEPTSLPPMLIVAIASMAGLALGVGSAYLLEYLDEAIQNPDELAKIMDVPILGYFADIGRRFGSRLYVAQHPRSLTAEAFRTLRANLELKNLGNGPQTLLITSPDTGDGKTSVAVNLAVSFAQGGKRVILVDGDLRKPSLHDYFEIEGKDKRGLTELLRGNIKPEMALRKWEQADLRFITVGDESSLPDVILTPDTVQDLLNSLKTLADVIIIDSSPFLVSDAMIFAAKVDSVLVVIRPGYTNREMAKVMRDRIEIAGGKIRGIVLNRIPLQKVGYYGNYRYHLPYGYYEKDGAEQRSGEKARKKQVEEERAGAK